MGCGSSKAKKQYVQTAMDNDPAFKQILETCGVTIPEVSKLFDCFTKVDTQANGKIDMNEFYEAFIKGADERVTPDMCQCLFKMLDDDKTTTKNELHFREFFIGVYNVCTARDDSLVALAFNFFDQDDDAAVGVKEVKEMLTMIYGARYASDAEAQKVFGSMDKDVEGNVNLKEFKEGEYKNPNFTKPMKILKEHLRGKLLGDKFWTPLTIKRKDRLPTNDDIIDMYRRLRTENADFKRQMRQADAAGSVAPSG